jgi:hypothetical protein
VRTAVRLSASAALGAALALGAGGTAEAHDVHHLGRVTVALGWLHEPAYTGADNAVQVLLTADQVAAITADLTVDVSIAGQTLTARPLVPSADADTGRGTPGEYLFHFTPTAPGRYTFHLHGTAGGEAVDETVESSPSTFEAVQDPAAAEFPVKLPGAADVSAKTDRTNARAERALAAAAQAQDAGDRALLVGELALAAAVVLGLLNVILWRRRTPR